MGKNIWDQEDISILAPKICPVLVNSGYFLFLFVGFLMASLETMSASLNLSVIRGKQNLVKTSDVTEFGVLWLVTRAHINQRKQSY